MAEKEGIREVDRSFDQSVPVPRRDNLEIVCRGRQVDSSSRMKRVRASLLRTSQGSTWQRQLQLGPLRLVPEAGRRIPPCCAWGKALLNTGKIPNKLPGAVVHRRTRAGHGVYQVRLVEHFSEPSEDGAPGGETQPVAGHVLLGEHGARSLNSATALIVLISSGPCCRRERRAREPCGSSEIS